MEHKLAFVGQAAFAVAQHGGADRARGAGQRDDVHLGSVVHDDLLPGGHPLDGLDLVAQQRGGLKIQPVGGSFHLFAQLLDDVLFAVADHVQRALHGLVVGLAADLAAAHGHALADVGVQAGARLAEIPREDAVAARQQKTVLRQFHHLAHGKGGGERADVVGIVVVLLQRGRDARPRPFGHLDIAVALVVLEQDVVLGGVGFDLAGFQHKGLKLRLADDDVEAEGVGDHLGDFGVVGHALAEILRYARFEALGLADIDDGIGFVADDIHARQKGQHTGFLVEFGFGHGTPGSSKKSM